MSDADPATVSKVFEAVCEAIPGLPTENVVALLDFIHVQHSGSNFNPDNTHRASEIIDFVERTPFVVSASGVDSLACLARHALARSEGHGNTAEHQLWLLASSALNTAAAIADMEGDAARLFDAVERGAAERAKYVQRHYATRAMSHHVAAQPAQQAATRSEARRRAIRRALAPENLAPAAVIATIFAVLIAYLLSLYIVPMAP
mmetsp:Transcript_7141/g.14021  ORF Transcript_7141/g.14021 Transcript_7141/m.14021 type:complete len:204 (-) Transcript_7141:192-803(-)